MNLHRPRLIVFLMIDNGYLRKSQKFGDSTYIGDPLNTVQIFSDLGADEIILVDINATREQRDPDYDLIKNIASVARMPICYGGGINNLHQIDRLIKLGIEKISICSAVFLEKDLIKQASVAFGKQSIVGCLDIKYSKKLEKYHIYSHRGSILVDKSIDDAVQYLIENGVGEIFVNNIDLDGTYKGFDKKIISKIVEMSPVPISVSGGASSLEDIKNLWNETQINGIAAGSLWSFIDKNNTVLLNYPDDQQKLYLFSGSKKT
jgi:cyclase